MQIKPFYKTFNILEEYGLGIKDDTNSSFSLCKIEATPKTQYKDEYVEKIVFWRVLSDTPINWNNGAVSRTHYTYYKEKNKNPKIVEINGFLIQEVYLGECGNVVSSNLFSKSNMHKYELIIKKL